MYKRQVLGYGLIHVKNKKISLINFGVIHLKKLPTHPDKLKRIYDRLDGIINEFKPDEMAIEAPFFGKNVQSMLKLGRAQGVSIAAALRHNIPFEEYTHQEGLSKQLQEVVKHLKNRLLVCFKNC